MNRVGAVETGDDERGPGTTEHPLDAPCHLPVSADVKDCHSDRDPQHDEREIGKKPFCHFGASISPG